MNDFQKSKTVHNQRQFVFHYSQVHWQSWRTRECLVMGQSKFLWFVAPYINCVLSDTAKEVLGIQCRTSKGKGRVNPWMLSLVIAFLSSELNFRVDLWFPLVWWKVRSSLLEASSNGDKGKEAPLSRISFNKPHKGWSPRSSTRSEEL